MKMQLTFGEELRRLREDRGLNQTQLGEAVHMTQRKISYLENGRYEPSLEDLRVLCRYFQLSADYFLGFPRPLPFPTKNKK